MQLTKCIAYVWVGLESHKMIPISIPGNIFASPCFPHTEHGARSIMIENVVNCTV